jgi:hypothetical protein
MAACGFRHEDIALVLEISEPTLRKHFRQELDQGAPTANRIIAQKLFEKAKDGDTIAMLFWLKCRAGWKETSIIETGKPKQPLPAWLLARLKAAGTTKS